MKDIILFDLDETVHYSHKFKRFAWNRLLSHFGINWDISNSNPQHELEGLDSSNWPERGLSPENFTLALLKNLNLGRQQLNLSGISEDVSTDGLLLKYLLKEWSENLISAAKDMDVAEIPQSVELIKKLYENGYRLGIVSQAPTEYAGIILNKLGLIGQETDYISGVVGGDMVEHPKPHRKHLAAATRLVWENNLKKTYKDDVIPVEEYQQKRVIPLALVGDSKSDLMAGMNFGIPVYMIDEIILHRRMVFPDGSYLELNPPDVLLEKSK